MMSQKEVEKRILSGDIGISYSFLEKDGKLAFEKEEYRVRPESADDAYKMFKDQYFGDRLRITLGPIVRTYSKKHIKKRVKFKSFAGCFDIRESENTLTIYPGETLHVASNERVVLNEKVGAILLPRLSLVDAGIIYVPSYIDPCWNGLLQAVITNVSREQIKIRAGEAIAICKFHPIFGDHLKIDGAAFASKSHHYGHCWRKIIEGDVDPFPVRKKPSPQNGFEWLVSFISTVWTNERSKLLTFTGLTAVILFLVMFIFSLGSKYTELESRYKKIDRIDDLDQRIRTLERAGSK